MLIFVFLYTFLLKYNGSGKIRSSVNPKSVNERSVSLPGEKVKSLSEDRLCFALLC